MNGEKTAELIVGSTCHVKYTSWPHIALVTSSHTSLIGRYDVIHLQSTVHKYRNISSSARSKDLEVSYVLILNVWVQLHWSDAGGRRERREQSRQHAWLKMSKNDKNLRVEIGNSKKLNTTFGVEQNCVSWATYRTYVSEFVLFAILRSLIALNCAKNTWKKTWDNC